MKRFITHEELVRDQRFINQDSPIVTILSQVPDDVDTLVEMLDKLSPAIEKPVRGTEAEPPFVGVAVTTMRFRCVLKDAESRSWE